ncbi:MAG: hypothetical protein MJ249_10305 [Kiritimatiellae bacterium]|nr:hypothetical protein [Kiritimatiellia bacterium]
MTNAVRKGWFGRRFLLAVAACAAVLGVGAATPTDDDIFSPEGYTFLQYLESDGTAYIDTDVTMTSADGVEMAFMILSAPSAATGVFGSRSGAGQANITISYDASKIIEDFNNASSYNDYRLTSQNLNLESVTYVKNFAQDRWYATSAEAAGAKKGKAWTGAAFNCPGTAQIFGIQNTTWPKARIRLGYCRIFTNDMLRCNYIPARRDDGVLGLYDTVNKEFKTNEAATGSFTAGPASRYRQVEWIAANGTQWIDTGVKMKSGDSFDIQFCPTATASDLYYAMFGARESATANNISAFYTKRYIYSDYNNSDTTGTRLTSDDVSETRDKDIRIIGGSDLRQITLGSAAPKKSETPIADDIACGQSAALFAMNGAPDNWKKATARLYGCTIQRDGAPIRAFVPVVRTWDGVGEVFDTVDRSDYDTRSYGAHLTASDKNWIVVASDPSFPGEFLPSGLGRNSGLAIGEEVTFSCSATIASAAGETVGTCKGWSFERTDGTVSEGEGASMTMTLAQSGLYGKLTWRYKAKTARFRSQLTIASDAVSFSAGEVAPEGIPVLVRISESRISGFRYASSCFTDGRDIFFATDRSGANVIPHEIDTWNPDGESLVWVKMPRAEPGQSIYMLWGGVGKVVDPTLVWSAYAAVWHMNDGLADATGKGHDAIRKAGSSENEGGVLGVCQKNGNLSAPSVFGSLTDASKVTVSGWFIEKETVVRRLISTKTAATDDGLELIHQGDAKNLMMRGSGSTRQITFTMKTGLTDGNWKNYAAVFDGTTGKLYGNGSLKTSGTVSAVVASDGNIGLGGFGGSNPDSGGTIGDGLFDECRVYDGVAPAGWLKVEYATVAKDGFFTYGSARLVGQGLIIVVE